MKTIQSLGRRLERRDADDIAQLEALELEKVAREIDWPGIQPAQVNIGH